MKNLLLVSLIMLLCLFNAKSQSAGADYDLGFEKAAAGDSLSDKITIWGNNYEVNLMSDIKHEGNVSIRMQPLPDASATDFGCIVIGIPAVFKGQTIELKGWIKTEDVSDGYGGLILRVDGEGNKLLAFTNSNNNQIKGTHDWMQVQTGVFPYSTDAKIIYIGFIFTGKGKIWCDDMQLLIDGKDYSLAKTRVLAISLADTDQEFNKSSGIELEKPSESKLQDLVLLGKIWGFLKYYHPAIAGGKYNWDNELFRFLPAYIEVGDRLTRNQLLCNWIDSLGPVSGNGKLPKMGKKVKLLPELLWLGDTTEMGVQLSTRLLKIQKSKRAKSHYYFGFVSGAGNPEFLHENYFSTTSYPDDGIRLLAVYRYWNIIQYFFPNRHLIDGNWNDVLKEFIVKTLIAKNETEYMLCMLEMIGRISDTHANIWGGNEVLNKWRGTNYAPYRLSFIENKAVVTGFIDINLVPKDGLEIGDVILEVKGEPVQNIITRMLPYTPASNYPTQLRDIADNLLRSNDRGITVTIDRDGKVMQKSLSCHTSESINWSNAYQMDVPSWRFLTTDIGYLYIGSLKREDVKKAMSEFRYTKGIVIDLRCYPSDFPIYTLGAYLVRKSTNFVKFTQTNYEHPGTFSFGNNLYLGGIKQCYGGKLVILVNEMTQSSAEFHAMAFRAVPGAIVVGSTTAGADGNVSEIHLPGGILTMISGIGVYYPDGGETQRVGIVPDIQCLPTIQGIRDGRDEVLEKAVEIIEKQ